MFTMFTTEKSEALEIFLCWIVDSFAEFLMPLCNNPKTCCEIFVYFLLRFLKLVHYQSTMMLQHRKFSFVHSIDSTLQTSLLPKYLCMDFPLDINPANECFLLSSRRSLIHQRSSMLDPAFATIHNLRDFRFSRCYLSPGSGTRASSIYWDFLDECIFREKILDKTKFYIRKIEKQIELPIFGIRFDWRSKILSSRHQSWTCSIFSIFSWCNETSSRVKMSSSLCSDFFLKSCSVTKIKLKCKLPKENYVSFNFTFHHLAG